MRVINVAAAQMGPIQKAVSREAVVKRMIALLDEAKAKGAA
jgi:predicted amidohydrolase